jgi:hypothetical protein
LTISNIYLTPGATINDPTGRLLGPGTNNINVYRGGIEDVTLSLGKHVKLTLAAYS